jgi:tellurite resistance protein TehA-like permease
MGICGLSWRAAGQVLASPRAIGEWLIAVGLMLFIVLSALYGIKTLRVPGIVAVEFRDPSLASKVVMDMDHIACPHFLHE